MKVGVVVGALCLGLVPASAHADEVTARLEWVRGRGAASCPSGEAMARAVTRRLGRSVFAADGAVSVEATVRGEAGQWEAELFVRAGDGRAMGERSLRGSEATCEAFSESVALAVALAIDPEAALRPPTETAPVVEAVTAPVVPACPTCPVCPPARVVRPRRAPRWRLEGGVRGGLMLGSLPGAVLGVGVTARVVPPGFVPVEVTGWVFPETEQSVLRGAAEVGLSGGSVAVCPWQVTRPRWGAAACAGTMLGRLRVQGAGFRTTRAETVVWWSVLAGVRLRWTPVDRVWFEGSLEGNVPLVRTTLEVESLDMGAPASTVFTPSAVGLLTSVGVGVRFD